MSDPTMVTARRASSVWRVVCELVGPTVRTRSLLMLVVAIVASMGFLGGMELRAPEPLADAVDVLRTTMMLLAIGAGFLLDDSASETLAAVPFSLLRRRAVSVTGGLVLIAPAWAGLLLYADAGGRSIPIAALTLELAGWIAAALMAATLLTRAGRPSPGSFVAPVMIVVRQLLTVLPLRWVLLAPPGSDMWGVAHRRWGAVVILALGVAVWLSHDPAKRPLLKGRMSAS